MKIVIATDSFKESMTAKEACDSIEKGMRKVFPEAEYTKVPMADGGEGSCQSLVDASFGRLYEVEVKDPLGRPKMASYGISGDGKTGFLEMAAASGLESLAIQERNPWITTTYGTGELMLAALEHGVEELIIGIGGSATTDGGAGMLEALGAKLEDADGKALDFGGGALGELSKIDLSGLDPRLAKTKLIVACDVDNPLTGLRGAAHVFGPQKGADAIMVEELDKNLKHYAKVIREQLGKEVESPEGAGAAGGLGAGLLLLNAKLEKGIDIILDYTKLEEKLEGADLVLTGEGSIDRQTAFGKTPFGVLQAAQKKNLPCIALAGRVADQEVLYDCGFAAIFSIMQGASSLAKALKEGKENLEQTAENVARMLKILG